MAEAVAMASGAPMPSESLASESNPEPQPHIGMGTHLAQQAAFATADMGEGDAEARSARFAALRESKRSRLIRIGELVETLVPFVRVQGAGLRQHEAEWATRTAPLRQVLVSFTEDELPMCRQLAQAVGRQTDEKTTAGLARNEVERALAALEAER
jgi:hypothetical protein